MVILGPNLKFEYTCEIPRFGSLKFRDLTIADCFFISDSGLVFESELEILVILLRLLVEEPFDIGDLPIRVYQELLREFADKVLSKKLLTPEQALEVVYFLGGQKFEPNVEDWFSKPLTLLLQMLEVVKKYPKVGL